MSAQVFVGEALNRLRDFPEASIDALVRSPRLTKASARC